RLRRLLLHPEPARHHRRPGPGRTARPHHRRCRPAARPRHRPGEVHHLRAVPGAAARRAGVGADLPHRLRRG
ncbi:hypothetical protein KR215_001676, partial [Drosophila sulfurigaster]